MKVQVKRVFKNYSFLQQQKIKKNLGSALHILFNLQYKCAAGESILKFQDYLRYQTITS